MSSSGCLAVAGDAETSSNSSTACRQAVPVTADWRCLTSMPGLMQASCQAWVPPLAVPLKKTRHCADSMGVNPEQHMSNILENVDQRTQLAGRNRMELLLFRLNGRQRFGINVFKVREVINAPRLSRLPKANAIVRGIAHIRGKTIPIIDLSLATVGRPLVVNEGGSVIISEYNRSVQGFLVSGVDRIINLNWQDVLPPPAGTANGSYVTAVAKVENELVQIIDVEKVLAELNPLREATVEAMVTKREPSRHHVLVVDDSTVARSQIKRTLDKLGVEMTLANDGEQALQLLQSWAEDPESPLQRDRKSVV